MQKHALLIGVNQYGPDSHLVNLNYAEADATALGNVLQGQFDFQVKTLLGNQANRSGILRQLQLLSQTSGSSKDDIILFFFAGHGQSIDGQYVLHPYGAFANDDIESLAFADLLKLFRRRFNSGQILSIVDACHNQVQVGGTRGSEMLTDVSRDVKYVKNQTTKDMVIKSLLSCSEGEVSWETEEYGHGVFSKYLIDILENKCHSQSFDSAIVELGQLVPGYVKKKYGVTQTPWFEKPLSGDTWLLSPKMRTTKPVTTPEAIPPKTEKFSINDLKSSGILEEYIKGDGVTSGKEWFKFYKELEDEFELESIQQLKALVEPIISQREHEAERCRNAEAQARKKAELERKIKEATQGMVLVEGGRFEMGGDEFDQERPVHKVYVDSFYIDKYQVTNKQYADFINAYGSDTVKSGENVGKKMIYEDKWGVKKSGGKWQPVSGYENHPVINVTWYGANEFARFYGKRLPTEAEWEYAGRGGQQSRSFTYSGSDDVDDVAWYADNSDDKTYPVGQKQANELGLYDMSGNVWEWCADWYAKDYYKNSPEKNPKGPVNGEWRVMRGGSWYNYNDRCRLAYRTDYHPDNYDYNSGFRCAHDLVTL